MQATVKASLVSLILLLATLTLTPAKAEAETNNELPSIGEFSQAMQEHSGYFRFFYAPQQDKIYLEVPRQNQAFIFQTSLPWGLGSNDIGLDRGQLGATRLARFIIAGNKVLLQQENTQFRAQTANAAERASIDEAFADSVIAGFTVVAADSNAVLIDYTPFLLSDTHGVSTRLAQTQQGQFKVAPERSMVFPARSKAFPDNTELEAKVTFTGTGTGAYLRSVAADPDHLTLHLHHSFIRLPDDNYQPRAFHPQSGFWSHDFLDYAAPLGQSMQVQYIPRHRFDGSEPIIYYLDPGVPEPVRTALYEGGMWWRDAFAALGYEDAFEIRELPAGADPMDVRYNVIQWVHRSTRGWSYGSSIIDPRTGEILKGHVTLGSLRVRQDMLIAQGLLAPFAEQYSTAEQAQLLADIEAMALARIRQLSAHEIGHTLGIAHNFAASTENRSSVMDYPHPLVQLTADAQGLSLANAYAEGIGAWDKRVIAYGYSDQQPSAVIAENKALGFSFISDRDARPVGGAHPTAHLWDNGENPAAELTRLLQVRRHAIDQFGLANLAEQQPVSRLQALWVPIYLLHRYQTEAAVKLIAGVDYQYAVNDGSAVAQQIVPATMQRQALQALMTSLSQTNLTVPTEVQQLLLPLAYGEPSSREYFSGNTGLITDPHAMAASLVRFTLDLLLNQQRLERLLQQHEQLATIPSVADVLAALEENLIAPARAQTSSSLSQQIALETLTSVARQHKAAQRQHALQAQFVHFMQQQQRLWLAAPSSAQRSLALHAIERWFAGDEWPLDPAAALPPGSPI